MVAIANTEREFLTCFCRITVSMYQGLEWDDVEPHLQRSWERLQGDSGYSWIAVRDLVRLRWARMEVA